MGGKWWIEWEDMVGGGKGMRGGGEAKHAQREIITKTDKSARTLASW